MKNGKQKKRVTRIIFFLVILFCFTFSVQFVVMANPGSTNLSPILNIPLDSWIYTELAKMEYLNLLQGEATVALNTRPLTRLEVAGLINQALINLERGKIEVDEAQLIHLEKLVIEFEEELSRQGVKIIPKEKTNQEILNDYQGEKMAEYINYFIQKGYLAHSHSGKLEFPIPRRILAERVSLMIFALQDGHLKEVKLTEQEMEYLDYMVTELKDDLAAFGIKVVCLNKRKALLSHIQDTISISGYLNQKLHLKGQNNNPTATSSAIKINQGLYDLRFGTIISGEIWENVAFLTDISVDVQVFDLSNIQFSPIDLNLNKAYLKFKTDAFQIPVSDNIPVLASLDGFEIPAITWQIGRDEIYWGPGYSGSLILSNNTKSLDMISYSGNFDLDQMVGNWGKVHFTKFFSFLDEDRLLFGQRFEYSPDTTWRIGLSETAIAAADCGILYFNPVPFPLVNYLTQQIYSNFPDMSKKENNINYNIGLDLQYQLDNGTILYGEIMFDDFIFYQQANPYPGRYGLTLGSHIPNIIKNDQTDLVIEYTRINNYVYFPREEWQNYLYRDEYLGHPLGPDADQVTIGIHHQVNEDTRLELAYIVERHGEGQYGIPLPSDPDIANENQFLSGVLEKSNNWLASIEYDISDDWQLSLTGSYKNTYNQDNQLNQNVQDLSVTAEIKLKF
jgi:hypothetical protein